MSAGIKKVCVIGAGTMGAGIAAQIANAGVPVLLLDIVRDPADRSSVARGAVEKLLKTEPDLPQKREAWRQSKVSVSKSVIGDR